MCRSRPTNYGAGPSRLGTAPVPPLTKHQFLWGGTVPPRYRLGTLLQSCQLFKAYNAEDREARLRRVPQGHAALASTLSPFLQPSQTARIAAWGCNGIKRSRQNWCECVAGPALLAGQARRAAPPASPDPPDLAVSSTTGRSDHTSRGWRAAFHQQRF